MQNNSIAIVGCGISGISASIELLKRNIPHTIFEARNIVGGRFYSIYDRHLELEIDNGQHLIFFENKNFLELIEFITKESTKTFNKLISQFETIKSIPFFSNGNVVDVNLNRSSPFSQLISFFRLLNNPRDLYRLIVFLKGVNNGNSEIIPHNISTLNYLKQKKFGEKTIKRFWEPICVSVFNNSLEKIPAYLTINVIKTLFASKQNLSFYYLKIPQSCVFAGLYKIIQSSGSDILFSKSIKKIIKEKEKFVLFTQNDEKFFFDKVILCLPPNVLKKILPEEWIYSYCYFKFLEHINFNPILSINILTNYQLTQEYLGFFLNSPIHWIFNKNKMYDKKVQPYLYTFTTSNAFELINLSTTDILELLSEVIQNNFCIDKFYFRKNILLKYKIIREKFATIDLNLDFAKYRPEQETPIEGLFIAGDWTQTYLPATLESAALSGKIAVEKLLTKFS